MPPDPAADLTEEDLDLPERVIEVELGPDDTGVRLDKILAERADDLSRARLQALIDSGAVTRDGEPVGSGSAKAAPGLYRIAVPLPLAAEPEPQDIPLVVLFEDAHLIVIDKPAGMAAHPGPGTPSGTLVNALLHHCKGSLSGVGGIARPGIVHRLDKDTSGVMVATKTDQAHAGLSALFARHDIERLYIALTRGAPHSAQRRAMFPGQPSGNHDLRRGVIATRIARSAHNRKKMAVVQSGGREAITIYNVERKFGPVESPLAARVACRLETGRTHQIRVHMAHLGAPCLGDPVYGSTKPVRAVQDAIEDAGLKRQALHAAVLGFVHPITGEALRFETPPPADMTDLEALLAML